MFSYMPILESPIWKESKAKAGTEVCVSMCDFGVRKAMKESFKIILQRDG